MKVVKHYACEICKSMYNDKGKARECEKSHKTLKEVLRCEYQSISIDRSGYPLKIAVIMDDGRIVTYRKLRVD